jgi:hypothetical protein
MSERKKFKIPAEIKEKYKGKCKCGGLLFEIEGRPVCGKCSIEKAKKQAQEVIPTGSKLGEFYNQKQEEKGKRKTPINTNVIKALWPDKEEK